MAMISRTDAAALSSEEVSSAFLQSVEQASVVLSYARRLPDMNKQTLRVPVLSLLPSAYFVTGDTGAKQTTNAAWENKYLTAEEIAVIVPIPEAVLDDSDYDIWAQVQPLLATEIGRVFDKAVLYGTNAPASWPTNILAAATAAGNAYVSGSVATADLYDEILSSGGVYSMVESDGYMVTGSIAHPTLKGSLRGMRSADGVPIFKSSVQSTTQYELDGAPIVFPTNGAVDPTQSLLISGDFSQLVYSMRQDITFKVLDQAVIQDSSGDILYNLAQQDMKALRCVVRLAWQVPNKINYLQPIEANRYPFAVLKPT